MILKKYSNFINEATIAQMDHINDYVLCGSNFKGISPVKGKYAKIISSDYRYIPKKNKYMYFFTLEFDTPLIDKRTGVNIETNVIEISYSQIKGLVHFNAIDYRRSLEGHTLLYQSSPLFSRVLQLSKFRIMYKTYDCTYFDFYGDMASFLPANKIAVVPAGEEYTSKQRQYTKIGRVLKKLNDKYTEQEIEKYSNEIKAFYKMINGDIGDRLRVVTGDLITYWYLEDNYCKRGGTLNNSCMRYSHVQNRVKFYSKHPDKIALCILTDDNNKLLARALVWKLDNPEGVIFMDRIYYVLPEHELILSEYAKKNNMKTKLSGFNINNELEVEIKPYKEGDATPYLDTLHYEQRSKKFMN